MGQLLRNIHLNALSIEYAIIVFCRVVYEIFTSGTNGSISRMAYTQISGMALRSDDDKQSRVSMTSSVSVTYIILLFFDKNGICRWPQHTRVVAGTKRRTRFT